MAFFSKLFKAKRTEAKPVAVQPNQPKRPSVDLDTVPLAQLADALLAETDATLCLKALKRFSTEEEFLPIACQHGVAAVRLSAAEHIHDFELLQSLLNQVKGKDKTVYRLARTRIAEQREVQAEKQARQERIQYLLEQAQYLNRVGYHPEFSGKLQIIKQEWPELSAEASNDIQNSLQAELQAAEQLLEKHAAEEAAQAAQVQAQTEAQSLQQTLLEQAQELLEQAHSEVLASLEFKVQQLTQQWDESLAAFKPEVELGKQFEHSIQQLLRAQTTLQHYASIETAFNAWLAEQQHNALEALAQAEQWQKQLQWPDAVESPQWYQQFKQKLAALKGNKAEQQQQQKELLSTAEKTLKALEKAIKDGHVKEANKHNQQVIQLFKQLPQKASQALRRQQQGLFAQLQEMRDWAGFAIIPKKEALINEMQSLIGSPIANNLLAEKIQALQEEWKALSTAGVRDHELWQQFSEAAEKAFEPCKAFFAEQSEIRKKFAEQRQALTAELDHYEQAMDWAVADWPAVQKTLETARSTFRSLGPIEHNLHIKTLESFNNVCDRIYMHLKQQYDRNLELKRTLVTQAEKLAASEELKGIVDKVKALQANWKDVGVTPRGPDQKLWRQFREHCDAIFQRLDEQRQERKAEISETVTTAESLVTAALASQDEQALKEANQHIHSVSLPKAIFQKLNKQLSEAKTAQEQAAQQQAMQGLIARLENLHADDAAWQQACEFPLAAGYNADLFQQARDGKLNNEESAHDLCLLMEIVADQPSPASDNEQRMQLQVQRLAEGLGKGLSQAEEAQQLIERWLAVQSTPELTQRMIAAFKQII